MSLCQSLNPRSTPFLVQYQVLYLHPQAIQAIIHLCQAVIVMGLPQTIVQVPVVVLAQEPAVVAVIKHNLLPQPSMIKDA